MRRLVPVRLAVVALAVGSLTAVPLAGSASAVTATTCSTAKITFNAAKFSATSTLGGCTNAAATGGSGNEVINFKVATAITAKVTWNKTGTTTLKISEKPGTSAQTAVCVKAVGAKASAVVSTGVVTGGTGAALKGIPKGAKFSESLCVSAKLSLSLYPKTKIVF